MHVQAESALLGSEGVMQRQNLDCGADNHFAQHLGPLAFHALHHPNKMTALTKRRSGDAVEFDITPDVHTGCLTVGHPIRDVPHQERPIHPDEILKVTGGVFGRYILDVKVRPEGGQVGFPARQVNILYERLVPLIRRLRSSGAMVILTSVLRDFFVKAPQRFIEAITSMGVIIRWGANDIGNPFDVSWWDGFRQIATKFPEGMAPYSRLRQLRRYLDESPFADNDVAFYHPDWLGRLQCGRTRIEVIDDLFAGCELIVDF